MEIAFIFFSLKKKKSWHLRSIVKSDWSVLIRPDVAEGLFFKKKKKKIHTHIHTHKASGYVNINTTSCQEMQLRQERHAKRVFVLFY